jgi:hypothetical protein
MCDQPYAPGSASMRRRGSGIGRAPGVRFAVVQSIAAVVRVRPADHERVMLRAASAVVTVGLAALLGLLVKRVGHRILHRRWVNSHGGTPPVSGLCAPRSPDIVRHASR